VFSSSATETGYLNPRCETIRNVTFVTFSRGHQSEVRESTVWAHQRRGVPANNIDYVHRGLTFGSVACPPLVCKSTVGRDFISFAARMLEQPVFHLASALGSKPYRQTLLDNLNLIRLIRFLIPIQSLALVATTRFYFACNL
jgi:hypothetical protein